MIAAEKVVTACTGSGNRPMTSMPGTTISSLTCWTARSASPLTSFSAVKPAGITVAFDRTASAMPSLSSTVSKWMPLAPARE